MNRRIMMSVVTSVLVMAALGCGHRPAGNAASSAPGSVTQPTAPNPISGKPLTEVDRILSRTSGLYHTASTLVMAGTDQQTAVTGKQVEKQDAKLSMKFAHPNKMRIVVTTPQSSLTMTSDGKKAQVYEAVSKQFQESEAPATLAGAIGGNIPAKTIITLFGGTNVSTFMKDAKLVGSENLAGMDCYIVAYPSPTPFQPGVATEERIWISKKDGLIRKIFAKTVLPAQPAAPGQPAVETVVTQTTTIKSVELGKPLAPSVFALMKPKAQPQSASPAPRPMPSRGAITAPDTTGKKVSNFTMKSLAGEDVSLSTYRGRPVLVVFWTTLSRSAKAGMIEIQKLDSSLKSKGVVVLAVSLDKNQAVVDKFVKENGITLPVLIGYDAASDAAREFGLLYLPTAFVVDKEGVIRGKATGETPNSEIEAELAKIGVK